MAETIALESAVHEILTQMFVAFGQGAGTLPVSREVIRAGTREYAALVRANLDRWPTIEHQTLEYARGLGRVAAHLALHDAAHSVGEEHYRDAVERFAATASAVEYECPFCLAAARKS